MRGEQLVQCTGGYDVVTNVCVIAMVSLAVALLLPYKWQQEHIKLPKRALLTRTIMRGEKLVQSTEGHRVVPNARVNV